MYILGSRRGGYIAAPKRGHIQFFLKCDDYEDLFTLLENRLIALASADPDIRIDIDYRKLKADYRYLATL